VPSEQVMTNHETSSKFPNNNFDDAQIAKKQYMAKQEEMSQMLFSSMVIMFRVLKVIRLQDSIGSRPQLRYLFAVACIAAAN